MRTEFLAGFVKAASDMGLSDEQITYVFKQAMEDSRWKSMYESFPISQNPVDVSILSVLSNVKQAMVHQSEVDKLKQILNQVCE